MLDITALSNALRNGSVSLVDALGAQPFLDDAGEIVRVRGEDALIVPLGAIGDSHPRYALRLIHVGPDGRMKQDPFFNVDFSQAPNGPARPHDMLLN